MSVPGGGPTPTGPVASRPRSRATEISLTLAGVATVASLLVGALAFYVVGYGIDLTVPDGGDPCDGRACGIGAGFTTLFIAVCGSAVTFFACCLTIPIAVSRRPTWRWGWSTLLATCGAMFLVTSAVILVYLLTGDGP